MHYRLLARAGTGAGIENGAGAGTEAGSGAGIEAGANSVNIFSLRIEPKERSFSPYTIQ